MSDPQDDKTAPMPDEAWFAPCHTMGGEAFPHLCLALDCPARIYMGAAHLSNSRVLGARP